MTGKCSNDVNRRGPLPSPGITSESLAQDAAGLGASETRRGQGTSPMGQPTIHTLTQLSHKEDREEDQRPLDFRLIARLFEYTRPYASTRNWLLVWVIVR